MSSESEIQISVKESAARKGKLLETQMRIESHHETTRVKIQYLLKLHQTFVQLSDTLVVHDNAFKSPG